LSTFTRESKNILTSKEEHKSGVFEESHERNICTCRQDEIGEWKKLPNEKLHYLRFSPNPIRIIGRGKEISNSCHK